MQKQSKIMNQRGAAPVLELFLIVVLIGVLGFLGYRYYQAQQKKTAENTKTTQTSTRETYKRTTTVPSSWVTYTNKEYKFSFAHPGDHKVQFDVIDNPNGDQETVFSANSRKVVSVCIQAPGHSQDCAGKFHVLTQTLSDTASQLEKYLNSDGIKMVSKKEVSWDGYPGIVYESKQEAMEENEKHYLIAGNGYTYSTPSFAVTDNQTPIIVESFKILK